MPSNETVAFPVGGMNFKDDPILVRENQYRMGVNTFLRKSTLSQRDGVREVPLISDTDGLVDEFRTLSFQGAIRYSPSQGQSALQQAGKGEYLVVAASGRKFQIEIQGAKGSLCGVLNEIKSSFEQTPDLHQVWMTQAENYLISGNDFATTWQYDGLTEGEGSTGYNTIDRDESRLPNRMRCPAYYNSRVVIAKDDSSLLIGDLLHGDGQTDSNRLLEFVNQVYWATGQEVRLPTEAGVIRAIYTLPSITSLNNQNGLVIESEYKTYLLNLDAPRTSWSDTQILFLAADGSGCTGQFAYDVFQGDSVRRTNNGIETLSFSSGGQESLGGTQRLSDPIDDYLIGDYDPELRFASVKIEPKERRMFCTTRPWMSGANWFHRGMFSYNIEYRVWEGIMAFPKWCAQIRQLVRMPLAGQERMFALCGGEDSSIRLVEIEKGLRDDVRDTGVRQPIQTKVYTGSYYKNLVDSIEISLGRLQFDRVVGDLEWEVLWKSERFNGTWESWAKGEVKYQAGKSLHGETEKTAMVIMPNFLGKKVEGVEVKSAKEFRFLVKWRGKADLRGHTFEYKDAKTGAEQIVKAELVIESDEQVCNDSVFEYSTLD